MDGGEPPAAQPGQRQKASAASWYALSILIFTYMLGNADRQILATLIGPVQRDLGLTDVELSLVQGMAFAIFFSTGGLVAGWAVDRFSRRIVTMASLVAWSVFTGLCGMATSFGTLFAARMGVGIGESTMLPGGYSLITDLFPKRLLSLALGIYTMGANIGMAISFLLGGAIAESVSDTGSIEVPLLGAVRSWQVSFLLLGAVGVLFAPLFLTFKEPARREKLSEGKGLFKPAVTLLMQRPRLFAAHFFAFGLSNAIGLVVLTWAPAFLQRRFGWTDGDVGLALATVIASAGTLGPLTAGLLAERLDRSGRRYFHFSMPFFFALAIAGFAALSLLAPTPWLWLACIFGIYFLCSATLIYGSVALQLVTPNELRGRMVAIYVAVGGLLGAGFGPVAVALITEKILHDRNAVGFSMAVVLILFAILMVAGLRWGLPSYRTARDDMLRLFATAPATRETKHD